MFCLLYVCGRFLHAGCYHASTTVKETAVTATLSRPGGLLQPVPDEAGLLREFRERFHRCLTARGDALFCLADAVLCAGGRVTDLARLSLVPEFGRGHGALHDCLGAGRLDVARVR